MPINIRKGETEEQFISRCIGEEVSSGKEQDVSAAICYSYWRRENMSKLRTSEERAAAKIKYTQDFRGINLQEDGDGPCWSGYIQVGTKIVDGREVPDCRGPVEEMEAQPTIDSSYAGEPASGSVELAEEEINVLGYNTKNFSICPGAIALFTHLVTMPLDEDTIGMVRSAAQVADNVFRIEKEVISAGKAETSQLDEVKLLVEDFKDIIEEVDEEVGMIHDTSFMDGHILKVESYL